MYANPADPNAAPNVHSAVIRTDPSDFHLLLSHLSYGISYHGLQLLGYYSPDVGKVDLMMHALIRDVRRVPFFFHEFVHTHNGFRFVVIRADVHALYAQSFIIGEKLRL